MQDIVKQTINYRKDIKNSNHKSYNKKAIEITKSNDKEQKLIDKMRETRKKKKKIREEEKERCSLNLIVFRVLADRGGRCAVSATSGGWWKEEKRMVKWEGIWLIRERKKENDVKRKWEEAGGDDGGVEERWRWWYIVEARMEIKDRSEDEVSQW